MTIQDRIDAKAKAMPKKFRATYRRAMTGRSRKAAMDAFCRECMGWTMEPCRTTACPLYPYRSK